MSLKNKLRSLTVAAPKKFRSKLVELVTEPGELPRPPRVALKVKDPETGNLRDPRPLSEDGADPDAALEVVTIDLDEGKERIFVEVRQLTQAQFAAVRREATVNGRVDEETAALRMVIASCFEPATDADGKPTTGGTVKLYEPADFASLNEMPANAPWVLAIVRACGYVAGHSAAELGKG